jgi:hypothetical protein
MLVQAGDAAQKLLGGDAHRAHDGVVDSERSFDLTDPSGLLLVGAEFPFQVHDLLAEQMVFLLKEPGSIDRVVLVFSHSGYPDSVLSSVWATKDGWVVDIVPHGQGAGLLIGGGSRFSGLRILGGNVQERLTTTGLEAEVPFLFWG